MLLKHGLDCPLELSTSSDKHKATAAMTEGADTGGRRNIHSRAWGQVGFGCSFEVMRILELVPSGKRTFKKQRSLAQVFTLPQEWVPEGAAPRKQV